MIAGSTTLSGRHAAACFAQGRPLKSGFGGNGPDHCDGAAITAVRMPVGRFTSTHFSANEPTNTRKGETQ